jgi:hypothetical protein
MKESGFRRALREQRVELLLFGFTLVAYALSSGSMFPRQSLAPHFVYQADAFLHGQLALTSRPPNLNDWVFEHGRWYVSFPPFPAVLMVPFVALFGLAFDDTAFTVVFGALNVALLYRLLRRLGELGEEDGPALGEWNRAAYALLFGFGTLAWSCAIRGEVWFTAETVGVTLTLLYLLSALRVRKLALFALPIAAVAAPIAWMNWVRFGNPADFGHGHLYANRVNQQIQEYGLFHYHFLERNLHAAFTRLPEIQFHPLRIGFNGEGMSLFVTTPLFACLLWPREKPRLHVPLWLTAAAIAVPGFFYQNSGWFQFGFRFSLDYTPYLIVLLALGRRPMTAAFWALAGAGVAVNAWGAAVFNRQF